MAVAFLNVNVVGGGGGKPAMKLEEGDGTFRSQSDMRPPKTPGPHGMPVSREQSAPVSSLYTPARPQPHQKAGSQEGGAAPRTGRRNYNNINEFSHRVELYRGSVSTVYKALDNATMAPVVIKSYHKKKMAKKHYHKLEREVRAMMLMRGPYVVELYSCFADDDNIYLIMEFCEGGDLFKHLLMRGGKLEESYVCTEIITPLLRVLEKCHALRMMHRDIKPENIFLSRDEKLRLGDFGLAVNFEVELPFSRSGTLDYMAPEVLKNPASQLQEATSVEISHLSAKGIKPYTSKVDIWAVGVLAYELVCGKPPFEVEDESQTASLIMYSNNIKMPRHCSSQWCDFIKLALTKDPKTRPDAAALLDHPWIQGNIQKYLSHCGDSSLKACTEELMAALPLKPVSKARKCLFEDAGGRADQPAPGTAPTTLRHAGRFDGGTAGMNAHAQAHVYVERAMSSGLTYEAHMAHAKSPPHTDSRAPSPKPLPESELSNMIQRTSLASGNIGQLGQPAAPQLQQPAGIDACAHNSAAAASAAAAAAASPASPASPAVSAKPQGLHPASSAPVSPLDANKVHMATATHAATALQSALSEPMGSSAATTTTASKPAKGPAGTSPKPQPPMQAAGGLSGMSPGKLLLHFGKRNAAGDDMVPPSPGPAGPGIKARMMFHLRQQQPVAPK